MSLSILSSPAASSFSDKFQEFEYYCKMSLFEQLEQVVLKFNLHDIGTLGSLYRLAGKHKTIYELSIILSKIITDEYVKNRIMITLFEYGCEIKNSVAILTAYKYLIYGTSMNAPTNYKTMVQIAKANKALAFMNEVLMEK